MTAKSLLNEKNTSKLCEMHFLVRVVKLHINVTVKSFISRAFGEKMKVFPVNN